MIVCVLIKMLYSVRLRNFGWNQFNILRLKVLVWSYVIVVEEYYGVDFCIENLEYFIYLVDEIFCYLSLDNYFCELYERVIRGYKQ